MNGAVRILLVVAGIGLLAGCDLRESMKQAGSDIDHFHHDLDAGNWQELWTAADPQMKKAATAAQFA